MVPNNQYFFGNKNGESPFDGYFIMMVGQSNATSRFTSTGNLPAPQQGPQTGSYIFWKPTDTYPNAGVPNDSYNNDGVWQPLNSGTNDKPSEAPAATFGIDNPLGYRLYNTYGKECYFVSTAIGGTGVDASLVPTLNSGVRQSLYDRATIPYIKAAWAKIKSTKNLKPIFIIMNGETDGTVSTTTANNFEANTTALINQLRIDTGFVNAPVIITSLRPDTVFTYKSTIITAQQNVAANMSRVYLFNMNTARTPISSDGQHYNPIVASYGGVQSALNAGRDIADFIDTNIKKMGVSGWNNSLPYTMESYLFFTRMVSQPSGSDKVLYDNLINGLKSDHSVSSIEQIADMLYVRVSDTQTSALLDISKGTRKAVNNSSTFSSNAGYTGAFVRTIYNPATTSSLYTLNSGAFAIYVYVTADNTTDNHIDFGCDSGSTGMYINSLTLGRTRVKMNGGSGLYIANPISLGKHLIHVIRNNSANFQVYCDGVLVGSITSSTAGLSLANLELFELSLNIGSSLAPSSNKMYASFVGSASVSPTSLYNRLTEYLTAKGL